MRAARRLFGSALCVLLAGCAARPPLVDPRAPSLRDEIEALVRRGCYECLATAYAKARDGRLAEPAFESALLLAARAKELGLPHAPWIEAARGHLPAGPWQDYLDIVSSLPLDPFSGDREALLLEAARTRRPREALEQWRLGLRDGVGSPLFRAYLDLSLVCGPLLYNQRDAALDEILRAYSEVPLMRYRAGLCGLTALLHDLRNADFVDAEFELGRAALAREQADGDEALRRFRVGRAAFPASAAITAAIGTLHQQREEWNEAIEAYDATLTLVPTHREALLGRTTSLSHLDRHDEAIAAATTLLDLGSWYVAEAYYWRAWNRYRKEDIPAARADVDASKAASPDPATLALSGIIAWREGRLDLADTELSAALAQDFGYCEAALSLGGVRADARRWRESLASFDHAAQCFALIVEANEQAIAQLSLSEDDVRINARRIARQRRSIAEADARRTTAVERIGSIRRLTGTDP